ncbi:MAG: pilus assembly protein PilM [Bacillales bacterium]
MSLIGLFSKAHLSITIRDSYIRVLVTPNHEKKQVSFHQEIPIDEGIIEDGMIINQEKLRMILINLVQENGWKGATVSFFVHDTHVNIRKIQVPAELNEDEMIGYIMRRIAEAEHLLTYEEVQAVIDAETEYLRKKGFIDN